MCLDIPRDCISGHYGMVMMVGNDLLLTSVAVDYLEFQLPCKDVTEVWLNVLYTSNHLHFVG